MTTISAFAANEPGGRLSPVEIELDPLGHTEVEIEVMSCGICYSDVSMIDNDWGFTPYPIVPGHEIIGRVVETGDLVDQVEVGDIVGVGWHSRYCQACSACRAGDNNMCPDAQSTFIGRPGGYADRVRASAAATFVLPDGVDAATAGPLMCGGITVFTPFAQFGVAPTSSVGVIGVGGLGHLAIMFARAWGCEVTAFTSTPEKKREAQELGAHFALDSTNPDDLASARGRFDLLISTVNAPLDWTAYLDTLRRRGRLHVLGAVMEPLPVPVQSLMMTQREVSSSPAGRPADIEKMLEFAGRHSIRPRVETFPMDQVNEAIDRLRSGDARYRLVLEA